MHNFHDLVKRYKRYRLRRFLKFFAIGVVILFLVVGFFLYVTQQKAPISLVKKEIKSSNTEKPKIPQNKVKVVVKKETEIKIVPAKKIKKIKTDKLSKKSLKKYSLQFLVVEKGNTYLVKQRKKALEEIGFRNCKLTSYGKYIYLTCNETNNIKELDMYIKLAKRKKIDYLIDTQYVKVEVKTKKEPDVKKKVRKEISTPMLKMQNINLQQLQKSFSQTPNFNIALLIARNYYTNKAYKKAIIWAKKANQFNKDDADSWLIYAKSLHALKQNKQAKQLLRIFLQYEYSDEVENLLKQWENEQ